MKKARKTAKNIFTVVAIGIASVWANKILEAKTYDAEATQTVAQILDARYGNDTTEIGREWRRISAKESITASEVMDFLLRHYDARKVVEETCLDCLMSTLELSRMQNIASQKATGTETSGPGIQPQPKTTPAEISKEAREFFSKTIEVGEKKMSALEYLMACGYTAGEIEEIYRTIKRDWEDEPVRLGTELLDYYAKEVTGRVLPFPEEKKPEPTQAQLDSLRGWAIDTLNRVFERSLGPAKKQWDFYYRYGDQSLDGLYRFLTDIRTLCGKGTKEEKVVEKVIKTIYPYTEEYERITEEIEKGGKK